LEGLIFQSERSDDMVETDVLSSEITFLMTQQRDAWRELASPTLTQFDRRELRNRVKQSEVELRDCLRIRGEQLRFRPRLVEEPADSLANISFRLF
jgi:hypothetical protein